MKYITPLVLVFLIACCTKPDFRVAIPDFERGWGLDEAVRIYDESGRATLESFYLTPSDRIYMVTNVSGKLTEVKCSGRVEVTATAMFVEWSNLPHETFYAYDLGSRILLESERSKWYVRKR